jgi:glucokinase
VEELAAQLLREEGLEWKQIGGVGVGVPGTVRLPEGEVLFAPNLRWKNVPLLATLVGRFPVPVRLDNDAHVAALGEYWRGAARGMRSLIMLTLGTGVGSALLLDGTIWRGLNGVGSEMGHMTLEPDGPPCGCGQRGCLEALVAAPALIRRAKEMVLSGTASILASMENWGVPEIFAAARNNDPVGSAVVAALVKYLAAGLANLVVTVDPEMIVLGGGVAAGVSAFLEDLRSEVEKRVSSMAYAAPPIRVAALGGLAGILGGVYLVSRG